MVDKDVKELVVLGASLSEGIAASVEDGKLSLGDYKHFLPALGDLIPALEGIENVPQKLQELSEEDFKELQKLFVTEFDIPADLVEEFVENSIDIVIAIFAQIGIFRKIMAPKTDPA